MNYVSDSFIKERVKKPVLVINFGGQYSHLIARRVRELNVFSLIMNYEHINERVLREINPCAIILSGGPYSVYDEKAPRIGKWLLEQDIPVLGICYGAQLIASLMGGHIKEGIGEYGRTKINIVEKDLLFDGWSNDYVWMSHRDYIIDVPDSKIIAYTSNNYIAAYKLRNKKIYGVQFHPEVKHTINGTRIIENFLFKIADCKKNWFVEDLVKSLVDQIKGTVGDRDKVLIAVSGGVDSTVTAYLLKIAIGERVIPVFINHGLLREGEDKEVVENLSRIGIKPLYIDAYKRFLDRLIGTCDCETRRKIIGEEYARIFKEIMDRDPSIKWFAQGTTYPDVVESGTIPHTDKIKTHHNVGGLPEWFKVNIIEPLKWFYKDEVRMIGEKLGIPKEIIERHPFPGPGLAVRIVGKFTLKKLGIARKASKIVEDTLKKYGLYDNVWQAFAVVGDDHWVGIKGDKRVEGYIVTIRIVHSDDGMTADYHRIPYEVLDEITAKITGEIPEVTMVTYAVTPKPPSTIEPC
ncbi:MAG: glutamine-hydrolyzing GMP synthase [Staphylothermus sp.]|nr:glutamine-hydrolyzing GMP synthase [Staphylothermus sp.]